MSTAEHERIIQHKLKQTLSRCENSEHRWPSQSYLFKRLPRCGISDVNGIQLKYNYHWKQQTSGHTNAYMRERSKGAARFVCLPFVFTCAFVYVLKLIFKASNSASSHIASAVGESLRKLSESANCSVEFKTRKRIFSEDDACNKPITNFELNVKALEHQMELIWKSSYLVLWML